MEQDQTDSMDHIIKTIKGMVRDIVSGVEYGDPTTEELLRLSRYFRDEADHLICLQVEAIEAIQDMSDRIENLETAYAGLVAMSLSDGEKVSLKEIARHS